jgi:hypothetical protein
MVRCLIKHRDKFTLYAHIYHIYLCVCVCVCVCVGGGGSQILAKVRIKRHIFMCSLSDPKYEAGTLHLRVYALYEPIWKENTCINV